MGMLLTAMRPATNGLSSTFTLANATGPPSAAMTAAACSNAGMNRRHGPHHGAHRSTAVHLPEVASSKSASPMSATALAGSWRSWLIPVATIPRTGLFRPPP